MKKDAPTPVHAWLVMMKATQAISRYALANLEESGLGVSDFAVLEVLLHKGPLPVNVIGPKVNLTPGSISVAVDRLVAKGLVTRAECSEDRRIRIVALTPRGKSVIMPIFRAHVATMEKVFAGLSADELRQLEGQLKRIGRQAESLFEHSVRNWSSKSSAGSARGLIGVARIDHRKPHSMPRGDKPCPAYPPC
jgi:MarR family 2-MHQ and catechol resistance regulon transcriptional repressor